MMKGKNLIELAIAVQEQADRKMDVVADTRNIEFKVEMESDADKKVNKKPRLFVHGNREDAKGLEHVTEVTSHALSQITEHVGVPAKYAERMLTEAPELLERNINHWFHNKPSLRMIRTLTNEKEASLTARAFLSNRYHRMENDQLLATVLPEIMDTSNGMQVLVTELTATRMYLKVVFPKMEGEVKEGDLVQYGFTLSNSEIGMGAMAVTPFVYRLVCLNGMTVPKDVDDARMRRAHLGRALEEGADYFTDETLKADDKALALKLRDTIRAMQDTARWTAVLEKMRSAANSGEAADPIALIERTSELLVLPKPEHNAVLTNFLKGGDLSKWGLVNAVTAVANEAESFDRGQELERAGGRILALPETEWRRLAKAA